jgi:hypothetical protein
MQCYEESWVFDGQSVAWSVGNIWSLLRPGRALSDLLFWGLA